MSLQVDWDERELKGAGLLLKGVRLLPHEIYFVVDPSSPSARPFLGPGDAMRCYS